MLSARHAAVLHHHGRAPLHRAGLLERRQNAGSELASARGCARTLASQQVSFGGQGAKHHALATPPPFEEWLKCTQVARVRRGQHQTPHGETSQDSCTQVARVRRGQHQTPHGETSQDSGTKRDFHVAVFIHQFSSSSERRCAGSLHTLFSQKQSNYAHFPGQQAPAALSGPCASFAGAHNDLFLVGTVLGGVCLRASVQMHGARTCGRAGCRAGIRSPVLPRPCVLPCVS